MRLQKWSLMILAAATTLAVDQAMADTFGTGRNQFVIDFVSISGSTNPTGAIAAGDGFSFSGVANEYRMGAYEITNYQWNKFKKAYGSITGSPAEAYKTESKWKGTYVPANCVSWCEAAQFVNWLNTSTGHQAAYKFIGSPGSDSYTFAAWSAAEAAGGTNLFRNKAAFYFLPTEDEWVKAAYWNGMALQNDATKAGEDLSQIDWVEGTGWNYNTGSSGGLCAVGSGSEELNGTYDMMGNVYEWTESPFNDPAFGANSSRALRGGSFDSGAAPLSVAGRNGDAPVNGAMGFRVASVPEPSSPVVLLGIALMALLPYWRSRA